MPEPAHAPLSGLPHLQAKMRDDYILWLQAQGYAKDERVAQHIMTMAEAIAYSVVNNLLQCTLTVSGNPETVSFATALNHTINPYY